MKLQKHSEDIANFCEISKSNSVSNLSRNFRKLKPMTDRNNFNPSLNKSETPFFNIKSNKEHTNKEKENQQKINNKSLDEAKFVKAVKSILYKEQTGTLAIKDLLNNRSLRERIKDPNKPLGYPYFEYTRKHPGIINFRTKRQILNNPGVVNSNILLVDLNRVEEYDKNLKDDRIDEAKEIKTNSYYFPFIGNFGTYNQKKEIDSFQKIKDKEEIEKIKTKKRDYTSSDLFKYNDENLYKSSEKYFYDKKYKDWENVNYRKTNIVNLGWGPRVPNKENHFGCSSVDFNILCPNYKTFATTKKNIEQKITYDYKNAVISQFTNITKPGATSFRKDYNDDLNKKKNFFYKRNFCSSYSDLYHQYKDLIVDQF